MRGKHRKRGKKPNLESKEMACKNQQDEVFGPAVVVAGKAFPVVGC